MEKIYKMKNKSLKERMKNYEVRERGYLTPRTNTIIRLDGKGFSKFTKGLNKPFDMGFVEDMQLTAKYLCENIQGCKMAYVASDEISLWLTDYDTLTTESWYDGQIQKITSISASHAASKFNQLRMIRMCSNNGGDFQFDIISKEDLENIKLADFDSRVFQIPELEEVVNYFLFREQHTTRNSISMLAQEHFSPKQLKGKSGNEMQDMLMKEKGINWNDIPVSCKRGSCVVKRKIVTNMNVNSFNIMADGNISSMGKGTIRNKWTIEDAPIFSKDRNYVKNIIENLK
jgi:tRNA(His) 5'-end guanylyltransferase